MLSLKLVCVLGTVLSAAGGTIPANAATTNVVLAGAYGNLAGKYLWKALFSLYLENELGPNEPMKFYAAGRTEHEKGWPKVQKFLNEKVVCGPEHPSTCSQSSIDNFKNLVEYKQLKSKDHYAAFCSDLSMSPEAGRMFYLSVPPSSYAEMAQTIKSVCTPAASNAWLRVAFEKPFGSDLESAQELAAELGQYLDEDQIYRVDHYLGKRGVKQILEFRQANPEFEKMFNKDNVEMVEIVMTETESCEGRTGFYDEYGVIRDVHQNHLTEILALLGLEITDRTEDESPARTLERKAEFLSSVGDVGLKQTVLGQYRGYQQHVRDDRQDQEYESRTSTFAVSALYANSDRWQGVPFVILAGKQLEERKAYVRVKFNDHAGVHPEHTPKWEDTDEDNFNHVVFHIQGGTPSRGPAVYVGQHVAQRMQGGVQVPQGWTTLQATDLPELSTKFSTLLLPAQERKPDLPYDRLISAMYHGRQDDFVGTTGLLESWRIWNKVLTEIEGFAPRQYPPGQNMLKLTARHHPAYVSKARGEL